MKRENKLSRKVLAWLLALTFAVSLTSFAVPLKAYAYTETLSVYTVKVKTGYLALRRAQSFNADNEIGKLNTGDRVIHCPIDAEKNGYWYVYSPTLKKLGFVNKDYLVYKEEYSGNINYNVSVKEGYLALRSAKAFDASNEKGKMYTGDLVIVLDTNDPTYWIVYSPLLEMAGYTNKNYLVENYEYLRPYTEPDVPAVIPNGSYATWEPASGGFLQYTFQVKNSSRTRTITAFEIYVYAEDVWGERVYGETTYKSTTETTIKPGQTVNIDDILLPDRDRIYRVYAAVHKCRLSDGTICEKPYVTDADYTNWTIK